MAENNDEEDTFKILIASDCHLGYLERNPERGSDSFTTFEEILQIAHDKQVDFILLGGDLFHENKPSRKALNTTINLLRQYCMGGNVISYHFLSDPSENFKSSNFPVVNYEDPNLNISIPVFTVHGNHDDPAGLGNYSAVDILSSAGLVNYFGKSTDLNEINVSPVLLQKGNTKLALYGIGSVRDERLNRMFQEGKVKMLRPKENTNDWFNLLVLHQNRVKHGATNYIPEHFIDEFIDLVIWGHEHECRIDPEWNATQNIFVSQPGSSVATSLCHGESVPKHVGLCKITTGRNFKIDKIPLKTVRPMHVKDIALSDTSLNLDDHDITTKALNYCAEQVEALLHEIEYELSGNPKQPTLPLIRLRIQYTDPFQPFMSKSLGEKFLKTVANPGEMVIFQKRKAEGKSKKYKQEGSVLLNENLEKTTIEDLVKEYFEATEEKCLMLTNTGLTSAVQTFVEKEEKDAIKVLVEHQIKKMQEHLKQNDVNEDNINDEIENFKQNRKQDISEIDEAMAEENARHQSGSRRNNSNDNNTSRDSFFDSDEDNVPAVSARGRGRGARARGRASTARGRGSTRGKKQSVLSQHFASKTNDDDDEDIIMISDEEERTPQRKRRGRK